MATREEITVQTDHRAANRTVKEDTADKTKEINEKKDNNEANKKEKEKGPSLT